MPVHHHIRPLAAKVGMNVDKGLSPFVIWYHPISGWRAAYTALGYAPNSRTFSFWLAVLAFTASVISEPLRAFMGWTTPDEKSITLIVTWALWLGVPLVLAFSRCFYFHPGAPHTDDWLAGFWLFVAIVLWGGVTQLVGDITYQTIAGCEEMPGSCDGNLPALLASIGWAVICIYSFLPCALAIVGIHLPVDEIAPPKGAGNELA